MKTTKQCNASKTKETKEEEEGTSITMTPLPLHCSSIINSPVEAARNIKRTLKGLFEPLVQSSVFLKNIPVLLNTRSQDSYHHIPSKSMDHALPSFDVRDAEEASYFPALASSGLSSSSYTHAVPRPTRAAPTHAAPSSHAVNAPAPVGGSMLSKLFPSEPILVESKKPFAFDGDDDKQNQTNNNNSQQTAMRKVVLSTDSDDRHNHHPSHPPSANNRRASITMAPPVVISAPVPSAAASDKQLRSGEATPSELAETEFDILRREREVKLLLLYV